MHVSNQTQGGQIKHKVDKSDTRWTNQTQGGQIIYTVDKLNTRQTNATPGRQMQHESQISRNVGHNDKVEVMEAITLNINTHTSVQLLPFVQ
jgi:hypothetical protein